MSVGLLVSLTLPGVDALSASGMDVFSAALDPGRAVDLDEGRSRATVRVDAGDAAPPYGRVDPASAVVVLDVPER